MPTCSRDRNEQAMSGASNKAFDYLVCGLAVLVSNLPDWRSTFVEPGYGLPYPRMQTVLPQPCAGFSSTGRTPG
jgi:hypothetical protein